MPPFQGVKKKLLAASRSGPCKDLEVWVQPVNNHLYHCAALGEGNGPLMVSMWMSLLNHVVNKHDGHDGPYHECLHQPLSDRAWLAVGELTILFIVHHSRAAILMWWGEGRENGHALMMSHSCICTLQNTVSTNMASALFHVFLKQGIEKRSVLLPNLEPLMSSFRCTISSYENLSGLRKAGNNLFGLTLSRSLHFSGTPAYEKLRSIVASPRLLKDIQHLSPGTQTYYVEAFNSLLLGFASKSRVFSPEGMEAR